MQELVIRRIILYSQHVYACCLKTIVHSSANACPPARMQRLARFVLKKLEHTSYPNGQRILYRNNTFNKTRNTCMQQPLAFISKHCVKIKYFGLYQQ